MALGPTSARDRQDRYRTGLVRYDEAQALNNAQRLRARQNLNAASTDTATPTAAGLQAAADKAAHDAIMAPDQTELEEGLATTQRGWTAAQLWIWLQKRVKTVLGAAGNAPVFAARAWVTFGTDGAVISSGNVSSVNRLAEGRWRINFATALPHASYTVVGNAVQDDGSGSSPRSVTMEQGTRTTSGVVIQCRYSTSGSQGLADSPSVSVIVVC